MGPPARSASDTASGCGAWSAAAWPVGRLIQTSVGGRARADSRLDHMDIIRVGEVKHRDYRGIVADHGIRERRAHLHPRPGESFGRQLRPFEEDVAEALVENPI